MSMLCLLLCDRSTFGCCCCCCCCSLSA